LIKWLSRFCDRLVILETPDDFLSVSRFYGEFPQVNTDEALTYLQKYNHLPHQQ
jgi:predicted phosphoribosyltransferase